MPRKNNTRSGNGREKSAPLARARAERTAQPVISGNMLRGDGRIRVRHREYIADVVGSVAFAVSGFDLNPGLAAAFPWLSGLAELYESYVFHKLRFCYETQKSASTDGSVMLAVDFYATDADPSNKQQLMSYNDAVRAAVWMECDFQCSGQDLRKLPQRYVRCGALPANADQKTFDVGQLFVATQGEADTTAVGELYVEYDVELMTPQLDFAARISCQSAHISSGGTVSDSAIFGDAASVLGGLNVTASANTLTFDRVGQYLVVLLATGTGANDITYASSTAAVVQEDRVGNGGSTTQMSELSVNVSERGQTLVADATAWTTVSATDVRIGPYATDLS